MVIKWTWDIQPALPVSSMFKDDQIIQVVEGKLECTQIDKLINAREMRELDRNGQTLIKPLTSARTVTQCYNFWFNG